MAHQIMTRAQIHGLKETDMEEREYDLDMHSIKQTRRMPMASHPEMNEVNLTGFDLISSTMDEDEVKKDAGRCLSCDRFCNVCVTVCPHRR